MAMVASESMLQMSRPIERLPVRRLSNEPKEAMNCKSCRKRKIKCNRLRPSCEACKVFNVECVYDAVPKKRGPKTDVLEALLKRVNGLEKRLKDDDKDPKDSPTSDGKSTSPTATSTKTTSTSGSIKRKQPRAESLKPVAEAPPTPSIPQQNTIPFQNTIPPLPPPVAQRKDDLLDLYFERLHGKPYYVLDEAATRQRWNSGQLATTIVDAMRAVAARYAQHILGGYNNAIRVGDECAARAKACLNSDEPTIENLQTSLLLANAFFQAGKNKKSYMLLSSAISMALALGLHRELPSSIRIPLAEREGRRKLFWTCYLMDRFTAAGSKRPSLIADESISLRLPAWPCDGGAMYQEGPYFANGSNAPMAPSNTGRISHSTAASLIEITRMLGATNKYLAAGGVKGDSHFPWHSQSNLSRIRQDLELWASTNQEIFMPAEAVFAQQDSMTIVLARLMYHLIYCLIYRPFLPVDLIELAGTEQHQPWQLEATNLCFLHANAIANLVEVGKTCANMDWPAIVGYCLCTAGTIHVHGAHYVGRDGDFFAQSSENLSNEIAHLNEIRIFYAGIQQQRDTLQTVYGCHTQLVESLASNPMRFSPVFQMEDFFDRYPGQYIDGAHVVLADVVVEQPHQSIPAYNTLPQQPQQWQMAHNTTLPPMVQTQHFPLAADDVNGHDKKRRRTNEGMLATPTLASNGEGAMPLMTDMHAVDDDGERAAQSSLPTPVEISDPAATPSAQQTLLQNPFSPNFAFSPWPTSMLNSPAETRQRLPSSTPAPLAPLAPALPGLLTRSNTDNFTFGGIQDQQTPGGMSNNGSVPSETDKDPFLSLLEQLAENENSSLGGPSELDFYLRGQA